MIGIQIISTRKYTLKDIYIETHQTDVLYIGTVITP